MPGIKKISLLYKVTINELHGKISPHLLEGRKVREIIGALTSLQSTESSMPSNVIHLQFCCG